LREDLALLIELQKGEHVLRSIGEKKKALPEKLQLLSQDFRAAEARAAEKRVIYDGLHKKHREREARLKKEGDSLRKTRERLFEVKTNKEYQAILKEIEGAEGICSELESEIILILDELEEAERMMKREDEKFKSHLASYERERVELEGELEKLIGSVDLWHGKIDNLRRQVASDLLKKYDIIKQANAGMVVVSVWKAVCGGCHMNVPPQLYNELQKSDELTHCPNCKRIIYWYDQTDGSN